MDRTDETNRILGFVHHAFPKRELASHGPSNKTPLVVAHGA